MKKLVIIFLFVICLPFVLVGCGQEEEKLNFYKIDAVFNDESNTLECKEVVVYQNNSSNALDEVCFFLYPNAFSEGQKSVPTSSYTKAYINGESYGKIIISSVKIGKNEAEYSVSEGGNILTVETYTFFPDESIQISIDFTVTLANVRHRLGYANHAYNFGNFFPIACVYEGDDFMKNEFSPSGDPFYSDVSNFEVSINYPEKYILASTGTHNEVKDGETVTSTCKANKVRDFCFILSKDFKVASGVAGSTTINYYYYEDENFNQHLQTAIKAVNTFNSLFGEYPYEVLNVVKTNFCFGGMEYPNLVMIADDLSSTEEIDYVIVHEIAHQWWYGVVGNNQFENAWVDEGLTEFSSAMFYEKNPEYGMQYSTIIENAQKSYAEFVRIYNNITGKVDESMDRNLNQFATEPEYVNCTYTKGMLLFDTLRQSMSEKKFFSCLKDYYKQYAFKNSSAKKLIEAFCQSSHVNLESFFSAWTEGKVVIMA